MTARGKRLTKNELRARLTKVMRQRDRMSRMVDATRRLNSLMGSREELHELLDAATDALEWYAASQDGERAKAVLDFVKVHRDERE
jgi:hypothetical protein